jgi:hypothetical protein
VKVICNPPTDSEGGTVRKEKKLKGEKKNLSPGAFGVRGFIDGGRRTGVNVVGSRSRRNGVEAKGGRNGGKLRGKHGRGNHGHVVGDAKVFEMLREGL